MGPVISLARPTTCCQTCFRFGWSTKEAGLPVLTHGLSQLEQCLSGNAGQDAWSVPQLKRTRIMSNRNHWRTPLNCATATCLHRGFHQSRSRHLAQRTDADSFSGGKNQLVHVGCISLQFQIAELPSDPLSSLENRTTNTLRGWMMKVW